MVDLKGKTNEVVHFQKVHQIHQDKLHLKEVVHLQQVHTKVQVQEQAQEQVQERAQEQVQERAREQVQERAHGIGNILYCCKYQ